MLIKLSDDIWQFLLMLSNGQKCQIHWVWHLMKMADILHLDLMPQLGHTSIECPIT